MSNGAECCAYWICCDRVKAIAAMARRLLKHVTGLTHGVAESVATFLFDDIDIAPKGMLSPLTEYVHNHQNEDIPAATVKELMGPFIAYVQAHPYHD